MIELKTKKGKRIDGIKIDGKDIYLDFTSGNLLNFAKEIKKIDSNDAEKLFEISEKLFESESFKIVRKLELKDFLFVLNRVTEELNKNTENLKNDFKFKTE